MAQVLRDGAFAAAAASQRAVCAVPSALPPYCFDIAFPRANTGVNPSIVRRGRGHRAYVAPAMRIGRSAWRERHRRWSTAAPDNGRIHPRVHTGKLYRNSKEAGLMAQRICFLGRGGSGKSTVAQNLGHALALNGTTCCWWATTSAFPPRMRAARRSGYLPAAGGLPGTLRDRPERLRHPHAQLAHTAWSWAASTPAWDAWPAASRSLMRCWILRASPILQLDFILDDISGETPCTGRHPSHPRGRDAAVHHCHQRTAFASVTTANSISQAILRAAGADNFPVQLIVNNASCEETKEELASYARRATIEILASLDYCKELEYSSLAGKTVFDTAPDSACAAHLRAVADDLLLSTIPTSLTPFPPPGTGHLAALLAAARARPPPCFGGHGGVRWLTWYSRAGAW